MTKKKNCVLRFWAADVRRFLLRADPYSIRIPNTIFLLQAHTKTANFAYKQKVKKKKTRHAHFDLSATFSIGTKINRLIQFAGNSASLQGLRDHKSNLFLELIHTAHASVLQKAT